MVDKRAIDPKTGRPLYTSMENLLGCAFSCQSRNFCFILKSLIGKDTKEAYENFSDFFEFFEMVKNIGLPESEHGPQLQPMLVWSSQDMSSLWKCLKTGTGARKNCDSYFCHVCPCNSKDILFYTIGENRCDRCKAKEKEKCYHWDVGDKESINKFQEMLDSEITKYLDNIGATLDEIMKATKIRYKPNAVDKHSDVYNIEFVPSGTGDDDIDALFLFSSLVTDEMKLCNMPFSGTLEELREALKQQLVLEEKLILI